jgi:gamma-butyrobetaine dioxygenase
VSAAISRFEVSVNAISVHWDDNSSSEYPHIWLRDNDTAELHPTTRERTFDLTTVPIDIAPSDVSLDDNGLSMIWPGRESRSFYFAEWLNQHRPGVRRPDPSIVAQELWAGVDMGNVPRFDSEECSRSRDVMRAALLSVKSRGLVIFDNLGDDPMAGEAFGDHIGFKRETNFGIMFDVVSKPDPNNLAYTSVALPLHIDLTNQELVPGYQFLHCARNDATGGESVFADGYRICADLEKAHPGYFESLKKIEIPCRFHDDNCDIRRHRPVISQAASGEFTQLVFNAHIADVPDMPTDVLHEFYPAYQALMKLARRDDYATRFVLQPGEMVMFDNRRVMHGRGQFDPSSGQRHLRGYYIDRNEVDSRIRILSRNKS